VFAHRWLRFRLVAGGDLARPAGYSRLAVRWASVPQLSQTYTVSPTAIIDVEGMNCLTVIMRWHAGQTGMSDFATMIDLSWPEDIAWCCGMGSSAIS
jgi:hypothetical protein